MYRRAIVPSSNRHRYRRSSVPESTQHSLGFHGNSSTTLPPRFATCCPFPYKGTGRSQSLPAKQDWSPGTLEGLPMSVPTTIWPDWTRWSPGGHRGWRSADRLTLRVRPSAAMPFAAPSLVPQRRPTWTHRRWSGFVGRRPWVGSPFVRSTSVGPGTVHRKKTFGSSSAFLVRSQKPLLCVTFYYLTTEAHTPIAQLLLVRNCSLDALSKVPYSDRSP